MGRAGTLVALRASALLRAEAATVMVLVKSNEEVEVLSVPSTVTVTTLAVGTMDSTVAEDWADWPMASVAEVALTAAAGTVMVLVRSKDEVEVLSAPLTVTVTTLTVGAMLSRVVDATLTPVLVRAAASTVTVRVRSKDEVEVDASPLTVTVTIETVGWTATRVAEADSETAAFPTTTEVALGTIVVV